MNINNMTHRIVWMILLFCFLGCFGCCRKSSKKAETEQNKQNNIEYIHIQYVDVPIFTIVAIDCDDFLRIFSKMNMIKDTVLVDSIEIKNFSDMLLKLEPLNDSISNRMHVDTRGRIKIVSVSDTTIICMDQFCLDMGGVLYHTPKELQELMDYDGDW